MRTFLFFFLIISQLSFAQNVKFLDSIPLKADIFIGIDDFENYYFTIGNTLYKKGKENTYAYSNTQLGAIASVDSTNPFKILVFYKEFNSVIVLDNRLNELTNVINLTTEGFTKNVAFAGISSNNSIWLFSNDDNTLSLWNYKTKTTIFESESMSFYSKDFEVISLKSNYKSCYVFSKNTAIQFNEYGSFIKTTELPSKNIFFNQKGFFHLKNNELFYTENKTSTKIKDFLPKHKTESLVVKNNYLYFFDSNMLYKYEVLKI